MASDIWESSTMRTATMPHFQASGPGETLPLISRRPLVLTMSWPMHRQKQFTTPKVVNGQMIRLMKRLYQQIYVDICSLPGCAEDARGHRKAGFTCTATSVVLRPHWYRALKQQFADTVESHLKKRSQFQTGRKIHAGAFTCWTLLL